MPKHKPLILLNDIYYKECSDCNILKPIIEFGKKKVNKDGLYSYCKVCKKQHDLIYKEENPDKIKKVQKSYYIKNKETLDKVNIDYYYNNYNHIRELQRINFQKTKNKRNEIEKNKKQKDPIYKLICTIRSRISSILNKKKQIKNSKLSEYLGCSIEQFKIYIESKFRNNMNWDNYGEWHLDHIVPLAVAKNERDLYKLNHYTNLQPLWAKENLKKGAKICQVV